jgi:SAM-dependent methyltransferase
VHGVDPSAKQLAYARARSSTRGAAYEHGDAMALPFPDQGFDVAVMPLVIFFVSDPARGVAEMARVVRPGGLVAAYAWDVPGGGLPYDALQVEMRGMGTAIPEPPSPDASRMDALQALWRGAGLTDVETRAITVQRTFHDFDDYWSTVLGGPSVGLQIAALPADDLEFLQARMRARLVANDQGNITYSARANAVRGRVPITAEHQDVAGTAP